MKFKKYTHLEDFIFQDGCIKLTEKGLLKTKGRYKKITGSRIASVLGKNEYDSPFQAWCDILGFVEKDMEDFFVNAGIIIEPQLVEFASRELNKDFRTYDAATERYDVFRNNKIFGGIPDGEEWSGGKVNCILEIKTASMDKYHWTQEDNELKLIRKGGNPVIKEEGESLVKWFKNKKIAIPVSYQYQLSLYLYLRNINLGYFCVALLKDQYYRSPKSFTIDSINEDADINFDSKDYLGEMKKCSNIVLIEEMKINLQEFGKIVDKAKHWYETHVLTGTSPVLTTQDKTWFKYGFPDI